MRVPMAQLARSVVSQVLPVPADRSPAVTQRDPGQRPTDDSPLDFHGWEIWASTDGTVAVRCPSLHPDHPGTALLLAHQVLVLAYSTVGAARRFTLLASSDFRLSTLAAQNGN